MYIQTAVFATVRLSTCNIYVQKTSRPCLAIMALFLTKVLALLTSDTYNEKRIGSSGGSIAFIFNFK